MDRFESAQKGVVFTQVYRAQLSQGILSVHKKILITNIVRPFVNVEMDPFLCSFLFYGEGMCVEHDKQLKNKAVLLTRSTKMNQQT